MEELYCYKLHVKEVLPDVALRPYIRKYYFFENEQGMTHFTFYALPNGYVEIFLLLDNHRILLQQDQKKLWTTSFISGVMELEKALKVQVEITGNHFSGIWIVFTPVGVNRLLGSNLKTLTNRTLNLKDYWGKGARWLRKHVQNNANEVARVHNLNHYFMLQLKGRPVYSQKLALVLEEMEGIPANLSVGSVAREVGVSYKWLYRKFVDDLGLTPKAYLRIIRFDRACYMLDRYRDINETDIAHQCGYYDQAHFIHEFKKIMKMSPREYLRKRKERFYYHRAYAIP
jgi:AraC-like DNA-binding protein